MISLHRYFTHCGCAKLWLRHNISLRSMVSLRRKIPHYRCGILSRGNMSHSKIALPDIKSGALSGRTDGYQQSLSIPDERLMRSLGVSQSEQFIKY
ncbi:MAG: hypothetical protein A3K04_02795 [Gallionellales bacterium RBG_16_56_9]|nr:MAG: hypothetical protein A3K04_02795 [Gallionellales bacterium RBG_16_56_9]